MKDQKHLVVLLIITASLCSFLGGYLLTQPSRNSNTLSEQRGVLIDRFNGVDTSATPTPLPPGMLQATSDTALAPTSTATEDGVLYYHPTSGSVSQLDLETRRNTLISTASLPRLVNVIWSPDRNRVITVSQVTNGLAYAYFDYTTHEHGTLGSGIKDAVFSPDSQKVGLVRSQGGDALIQVADFNGKNPQTLLKTRLDGIELAWPAPSILSFVANDAGADTQSLYSLSLNGDLQQLADGQNNLLAQWSPDGSIVLYSDTTSAGQELQLFNTTSQDSQPVAGQVRATDCAWKADQRSIICAIEVSGETSIVQTNLATGASTTLFEHLIISPQNVFLSQSGRFLVMTGADQSLWEAKLPN